MDDYLALSLIIMGIAIGALLVIWGAMSLAFSSERSTAQRRFRSGSPSAKPQKQNTALNSSRKNRIPRMITEKLPGYGQLFVLRSVTAVLLPERRLRS